MERSNEISISTESLTRIGIDPDMRKFKDLKTPLIMGILNVTPDSFSDGGSFSDICEALQRGPEMVKEGASIIDIGGESTRPFADPVPIEVEIRRTVPVIDDLIDRIDVPISIDTRHAEVARAGIDAGASIVNDVNGLRDPGMDELIADTGVSAVIMHMKGAPHDMQISPSYEDVLYAIHTFLESRVDHMVSLGVPKERLFIDPGIGFGKRVGDNLMILRDLEKLQDIGCPILVGASRKSFIGKVLGLEVDQRLEGSLVSSIVSAMNGASVVRVHDVKETKRALDLFSAIQDPEDYY